MERRLEGCGLYKPRNTWSHQKLEEAGRILLGASDTFILDLWSLDW
jgi:hypothetical protein